MTSKQSSKDSEKSKEQTPTTRSWCDQRGLNKVFQNMPKLDYRPNEPCLKFEEFRECLYTGLVILVGGVASLVKTGKLPATRAMPKPEDYSFDPTGLRKVMFQEELRQCYKEEEDQRNRVRIMFAIFQQAFPPEIWESLAYSDNFERDIVLKQDAVELWIRFERAFGVGNETLKPLVVFSLMKQFYSLSQGKTESLAEFASRIRQMNSSFRSAGEDPPPDQTQALLMLKGVDEFRYFEAVTSLTNAVRSLQRTFPANLPAAYEYLESYTTTTWKAKSSAEPVSGSVFTTTGMPSGKKKKNKGIKNDAADGGADDRGDDTPGVKQPHDPCWMCIGLGFNPEESMHWVNKCPHKASSIAILSRHASELKGDKGERMVGVTTHSFEDLAEYGYADVGPTFC